MAATETAPVASVNMPNLLDPETLQEFTFNQSGTVGMPITGTILKLWIQKACKN